MCFLEEWDDLPEHLRGRRKESDYFKTKGYAALAEPLIKERTWTPAE